MNGKSECGKKARSGWQMRDLSLNVRSPRGQQNHNDKVTATIEDPGYVDVLEIVRISVEGMDCSCCEI
jgi:hypothetical protein